MLKLKIRTKVLFAILSTALLLLIVGAAGMVSLLQIRNVVKVTVEQALPSAVELQHIHQSCFQILDSASTIALLPPGKDRNVIEEHEREEILEATQDLNTSLAILENILSETVNSDLTLIQLRTVTSEVIHLADSTLFGESDSSTANFLDKRESLEEKVRSSIEEMTTIQHQLIERKQATIKNAASSAIRLQLIATLACLVVAVLFAAWLSRTITEPLLNLKSAVQLYAKGFFNQPIAVSSSDEVGQLAQAFSEMASSLKNNLVTRDYLDCVLNSMSDMVFVVDRQHYIKSVNQSVVKTLEKSEQILIGCSLTSILTDLGQVERAHDQYSSAVETTIKTSNGRSVPVSISSSSLQQANELIGMVYVVRDITLQKKALEENRSFRDRLSRAEHLASLGAMGGIVAHRFNQPLTSLRLFIQQSLRGLTGVECPEWVTSNLRDSLEEIESASTIVKEILNYTRRPTAIKNPDVNLYTILNSVIAALSEASISSGLLIKSSGIQELPTIFGAKDELEEIFFILIDNAIQAVPEGSVAELNISGQLKGDSVYIEFKDTCGGIAPENLDKIFDVFFTTKPRGQGTGLGLSILKQLVADHHGEVKAESEFGAWTKFTVSMPILAKNYDERSNNSFRS